MAQVAFATCATTTTLSTTSSHPSLSFTTSICRPLTSTSTFTTTRTKSVTATTRRRPTPARMSSNASSPPPPPKDNKDDSQSQQQPPHDIPESSIDWNKSWSDFQASGMRSSAPVGREPMSAEEKARKKMMNSVRDVSNSLPTRQQLFADWRFWIAVILALSLFTAFANSTSSSLPNTV